MAARRSYAPQMVTHGGNYQGREGSWRVAITRIGHVKNGEKGKRGYKDQGGWRQGLFCFR